MSIVLRLRNPNTIVIKILTMNHYAWLMRSIQPPKTQVHPQKTIVHFKVFTDLLKCIHKPHMRVLYL